MVLGVAPRNNGSCFLVQVFETKLLCEPLASILVSKAVCIVFGMITFC